jgi:hypothetical protein
VGLGRKLRKVHVPEFKMHLNFSLGIIMKNVRLMFEVIWHLISISRPGGGPQDLGLGLGLTDPHHKK